MHSDRQQAVDTEQWWLVFCCNKRLAVQSTEVTHTHNNRQRRFPSLLPPITDWVSQSSEIVLSTNKATTPSTTTATNNQRQRQRRRTAVANDDETKSKRANKTE